MPEHKSCKKRIRSDAKKREQNRYMKKTISTLLKKLKAADGKKEKEKILPAFHSVLDKAVKKGVIHKNKAARQKSRASKFVK
ncbi:MAG: 30S ribosomal protein S20 [Candidatus Cloacimonetes bacterium]|nr:30S ribosomal protein S20 [Candidatus Cloacimonadota bacterium]MBL7108584.1 30S ribosomal protein S20 [Candidatus Cloacimonadota bacterium]